MFLSLFLTCLTIFYGSQAVSFSGTVPPNIYTSANMGWGTNISASLSWNPSTTNLVVHIFKDG